MSGRTCKSTLPSNDQVPSDVFKMAVTVIPLTVMPWLAAGWEEVLEKNMKISKKIKKRYLVRFASSLFKDLKTRQDPMDLLLSSLSFRGK